MQPVEGDDREPCPHQQRKESEAPAVHFKGQGWTPKFHGPDRHATRETRRTHGLARENYLQNTALRRKRRT